MQNLSDEEEKEIEDAANSDPDAPLLTEEELKGFKRAEPEGKLRVLRGVVHPWWMDG